jgi:hypothetical protein
MKNINIKLLLFSLMISFLGFSQEKPEETKQKGHLNLNKFRQMYQEFSSPNMFRTAACIYDC